MRARKETFISDNSEHEAHTNKRDLSVSMVQANVYALVFLVPVALLALVYLLIWGDIYFSVLFGPWPVFVCVVVFVVGIVAHELLHGLSWVYLGRKNWSAVEFGFQWKALAPYAHLKESVEVRAYRWAVAMPGLMLGILPSLVGLATGIGLVMVFGLVFTLAAAGDALILWIIRGVETGKQVEDHPSRAGCYVIE